MTINFSIRTSEATEKEAAVLRAIADALTLTSDTLVVAPRNTENPDIKDMIGAPRDLTATVTKQAAPKQAAPKQSPTAPVKQAPAKQAPAAAAKEDGAVTINDIRAVMPGKMATHKEAIQAEMRSIDAANLSALTPEQYPGFLAFLNGLV